MLKKLFLACSILVLPLLIHAQIKRTVHEVIPVSDTIQTITCEFYDSLKVQCWPSNSIMLEITITHKNYSTDSILKGLIEQGRYRLDPVKSDDRLHIKFDLRNRGILNTLTSGEIPEEVSVNIFIPEDFEEGAKGEWKRKKKP
ncbi:MAG TPA: hypothetical protein PLC89_02765 [Haliscomenobacter sp.]|uniref:hypothetical protein n=1 Tax=Haliscomenobacter sp. TaxID=2717303 RepID=UPI002C5A72BA|nr:hypothetical protein [Haliscomenobacter sp.]HOY16180.1 hypothetical protein [Haliscomenobacter sp.]HPH19082.1 hypothetical protein [Haliscomenobacter sp.]